MATVLRTSTALVRTARPRQWTKNVLVLAAPVAAGVSWDAATIGAIASAFAAFTLAASAVYLLNDVIDVEADRRHPRKRLRPVASGALSPTTAVVTAVVAAAAALGIACVINRQLLATVALYLVVQVAYSTWLKQQPVIDLAIVVSGFLLRAIAGGVAVDVELSQWFLLVASFGSLFIVAGKRYSELRTVGKEAGTRRTLESYSESYLRFVWSLAAAVATTAYSLWAFEISTGSDIDWQAISIAPFVIGMLRYAVDVDLGGAGEPEEIVLRDPVLQVIAIVWLFTFAFGAYSA